MAVDPINNKRFVSPGNFDTELVLYYHPHSFYSQKVLFALHEKSLKFSLYEIDITNGEQYTPWFLEMNPKAEVPVLRNGTLVVPESGRILRYLEDNFAVDHIRLYPKELDEKILERVLYFHRKISRVPIGAISMGSFIHPDLCVNPKPPFTGLTRQSFLEADRRVSTLLSEFAKENQDHADVLLKKAKFQEMKREIVEKREEFLYLIVAVEHILNEVEKHLTKHESSSAEWLCCEQFTIADVSLALLLHRLNCLGLEDHYWRNNKRPLVEVYFNRICQRDAYQKSMPSRYSTMKTVWSKTPSSYKYSAAAVSAAVVLSEATVIIPRRVPKRPRSEYLSDSNPGLIDPLRPLIL